MISRPLVSARGENTSAAWGVTKFLLKVIETHQPDYLGVVFDAGTSERHEIYPAYKATREKMPTELEASLPRVRQIIEAFRIPVLELAGYEADDVIGTLARKAVDEGLEAVIVSGDKDFYQLIREGICLVNPGRGGAAAVEEEWVDGSNAHQRLGVPPELVTDYLGLIGDSSDNVPGVAGIGPKTALQLIERYGPIEEILAHAAEIPGKRAREALQGAPEIALLSKRLVTIRTDLGVELELEPLRTTEPDRLRLKEIFLELDFHSLVRDHTGPAEEKARTLESEYRLLSSADEVREVVARARALGRVAVDTETTSLDPMRAELVGVALSLQPGESFYLPFGHRPPGADQGELLPDVLPAAVAAPAIANLPAMLADEMAPLVELLESAEVFKWGENLKYDLLVLRRAGIHLAGIDFDTMIGSYLLDPGRREHGLDSLALQYLDHRTTTYQEVVGKGRTQIPFAEVALADACGYSCEDADVALRLAERFGPELERLHLDDLFRRIEIPLIQVLAEMEWNGIRIDESFFREIQRRLRSELDALQGEIHREAGGEFNINSNIQLREILFERLKLPVIKRTKTGASTDVDVLQALAAQGFRLPGLLMQYRQIDKLLSTYVEALPRMVNPETGRIHTSFNQTVAATG
ncbi:MAG: DNA polymerase, partial [Gemmatimonadota bacterium]|nr:DNA polymerase [Gemmatimonadota bacterium]